MEEKRDKNRNYAGSLLSVVLAFDCDIRLVDVSSITPARTRSDRLLKRYEQEEKEVEGDKMRGL